MYNERIETLMNEVKSIFDGIDTKKKLEDLKVLYMGKNGKIVQLNQLIKDVPNEEKREFGMKVNEIKNYFNENYETISKDIELKEINEKLNSEAIDVTLPGTKIPSGSAHPIERIIESEG